MKQNLTSKYGLSMFPHLSIACPQAIIPVPNQNKFSQVKTPATKIPIYSTSKNSYNEALKIHSRIH